MDELIGRLEKATGPNRELDAEIELSVYSILAGLPRAENGGWTHPEFGLIAAPPAYTGSLDAAMTLVHDGFGWKVFADNVDHEMQYEAEVNYEERYVAATPALALCIAALKARFT